MTLSAHTEPSTFLGRGVLSPLFQSYALIKQPIDRDFCFLTMHVIISQRTETFRNPSSEPRDPRVCTSKKD